MPRDTRAAAHKRAREKAQQERQKQKQQRRLEARERKDSSEASGGTEDPDIAGIQPGPQPRPEWLDDLDSDESDESDASEA
jgi:transcription initiation factor TFIID subunit TAF12